MAPPTPIPAPQAAHGASLTPNHFRPSAREAPLTPEAHTIIAACIYIPVALVAWNLPVVRDALAGLKLFVVGAHELFHLAVGVVCGGQVTTVCIDPNDGGATTMTNLMRTTPRLYAGPGPLTYAQLHWSPAAVATLTAGYVGSSALGFCYVFAAFDIVASKVASFTIAVGLLVPIIRADHWIAYASIIASEALLIGLWFGDHGNALRFYGILHLFYTVWDYVDERLFDKRNTSDCTEFAGMLGWSPDVWAIVWFCWESALFVTAIIAGIVVFQKTPEKMYADAAGFLPT
ncbi:hypothetical protein Q8F55_000873 [Vanrija albida]|uniref:Peptidase M50B-like-domain-containing protein n=1 Tax=Vanrija albida TaxID=181172 RepID=A0ABR3QEJ7_9TREE